LKFGLQIAGPLGHDAGMAKTPKRPRDPNQLAKLMVDLTIEPGLDDSSKALSNMAVLGRVGGMKGGKARAEALSPEKRKDIAQRAARARWK
jgi:hypothetical protein